MAGGDLHILSETWDKHVFCIWGTKSYIHYRYHVIHSPTGPRHSFIRGTKSFIDQKKPSHLFIRGTESFIHQRDRVIHNQRDRVIHSSEGPTHSFIRETKSFIHSSEGPSHSFIGGTKSFIHLLVLTHNCVNPFFKEKGGRTRLDFCWISRIRCLRHIKLCHHTYIQYIPLRMVISWPYLAFMVSGIATQPSSCLWKENENYCFSFHFLLSLFRSIILTPYLM